MLRSSPIPSSPLGTLMRQTLKAAAWPRAALLLLLCPIACTDYGQSPSPPVVHVTGVKLTPRAFS